VVQPQRGGSGRCPEGVKKGGGDELPGGTQTPKRIKNYLRKKKKKTHQESLLDNQGEKKVTIKIF